jgi:hypothetical protein
MAELSKTAKRSTNVKVTKRRPCSKCKIGESIVVKYAGYGPLTGFRWTCVGVEGKQQPCGFTEATRGR